MSVRRIYVEKKPEYAVAAKGLLEEIENFLGIQTVTNLRVLNRYDMEHISDATYEAAKGLIFSEPPVDLLFEGSFPRAEGSRVFSVEYLPGQFDQRADSAEQCVKLLNEKEEPIIRSATTYVIEGEISDGQFAAIQSLCINPVDSRLSDGGVPETLEDQFEEPADVKIFDGFCGMAEAPLKELYESLSLAMTFDDFKFIQHYFAEEEKRDPSMTEIRVLDTYWSDHCRHTTFQTELTDISFGEGDYREEMEKTYQEYLADRAEVFAGRKDKYVCLMDLALMAMRKLKKEGKLNDQEESDEINACSIVVPVTIDGVEEEWLISFKNETHNHPTEIEPFGGAATCLGGAIRDPLSGRSYVYQAMRVTGAADPTVPVSETLKGKLPQRKIVIDAAHGYSSYGNQIGLATGYVKELYHPNYVAKRMEIGAVMGAAPRKNVIRATSDPGDMILLVGGRTGRDGCGGATGSSKSHTEASIATCGAEVQKGNAPTERKIQRLFRRPEVSRLIKKCNDFGAGGVSVAIGELADGLRIDLNMVPKKYAGLDGTEIAISESQERMAIVIDPGSLVEIMKYINEENLEAVVVAEVMEEKRLIMYWRDKVIVNISRAFLDTNGAHQEAKVEVNVPKREGNPFDGCAAVGQPVKEAWLNTLKDLNVCSQKGLVEMFDSTIGAGSVLMPFGGTYQLTETQAMVAKLPVLSGETDAVTMMSYGFDPYLSSWSPYHGAIYAVISSVAKIVAAGGDYRKIRFTFQEYFRKLGQDPKRWGDPFAALLGAYNAQMGFGLPSIGGKDSMSGSFNEIDVPPTLVSFAVDTGSYRHVISPELKQAGNKLVLFRIRKDEKALPDYAQIMDLYGKIHEDIAEGNILSAYEIERHGLAEALAKMAFGNKLGISVSHTVDSEEFFGAGWGNLVAEVPANRVAALHAEGEVIGEVTDEGKFIYGGAELSMEEALAAWTGTLDSVFPAKAASQAESAERPLYEKGSVAVCTHKLARPTVFIPAFPGTNCEIDSKKAMEAAGANVIVQVMRNLTAEDIRNSVEDFAKGIRRAQIIMFPGGFSAGDEPDGSAKFFATAFRNAKIKEEVEKLLNERDGLALGICNGFQALIKLGLVPHGKIVPQEADAPTLTFNTVGRHISRMNYVKVVSNKSPWLQLADLGGVYCNPASHGEGRFVANEEWLKKLFENGQVATQYCSPQGEVTMDAEWNSNGSYLAVEGITSPDGRVLGKMLHCERSGKALGINIYGNQDMQLFEAGVKYFR
ncbi:phosphoribosylformylglycinamidine synthase [Cuneatibacter sp. NSJ-177]|uniref:phosphoribosylformylglycinamidine synthase n=1 Tax=Cuneatibacter sp. NSJ-177 TaxID=2931401 RepID=UPI001FD56F8E|nr:phosphoribosylformylglycinamidine synthase [Cuneatibacter sp. NSJ-177]MCJ7835668.1 phosphoribosylformylglycinamidine synthase [Cuneatibacter sp. NSJ-177]